VDLSALLDRLDAPCARYLLLESFQAPHPDRAATWLAYASLTTITRLLEVLCDDKDGRDQAHALLRHLPPARAVAALLHLSWPVSPDGGPTARLSPRPEGSPKADLKVLLADASDDLWSHLLKGGGPMAMLALLSRMPEDDVVAACAARALRQSLSGEQASLPGDRYPAVAARLHAALVRREMGPLATMPFHRALVWLEGRPPDVAILALRGLASDCQARLLARLPPRLAARLQRRSPSSSRRRWLIRPSRSAPLWRIVQEHTLDTGLRWMWMKGELQTEAGPWPLRVDLLTMDPAHVQLVARRAISESDLIPIAEVLAQLGPRSRADKLPSGALFDRLGLVRLSETVAATGAIAGINGGFYFDYGHYLDAYDLGLNLASVPGLAFGELAGWFVSGGITGVPPVFNRAALLITADGQPHIRRVFVGRLRLAGRRITWDTVNVRRSPEQVVLYNGVVGQRTPVAPTVVDVTVARGVVQAIRRGGGQPLPLWGAVLSVPQSHAREVLGDLHVGDPATFDADLPAHLGPVVEAMACGPQLVRDGEVDLDFDFEHFGRKDTTVLPLSLTRAANFFRAARSFVMLRGGELVLGTVSGAALGTGRPPISAGMTFGELARLVVNLGGDQAVGLDGGGSSTLVALNNGAPRPLNVPTGGADVPFGKERYINTYWLVFKRSEQTG